MREQPSKETKQEMFRFFMKTSIPRIVSEMKGNKIVSTKKNAGELSHKNRKGGAFF